MKRNAFTLIELIAVMGIIILLSTVTIGAYLGIARATAKTASTRRLAAYLNLARQRACSEGEPIYFITLEGKTKNDYTDFMLVRKVGSVTALPTTNTRQFYDHYGKMGDTGGGLTLYNLTTLRTSGSIDSATGTVVSIQNMPIEIPDDPASPWTFNRLEITYTNLTGMVRIGDEYGVSAYPPESLPKGFVFADKKSVIIKFNSDGTIELPPGSGPEYDLTAKNAVSEVSGTVTIGSDGKINAPEIRNEP